MGRQERAFGAQEEIWSRSLNSEQEKVWAAIDAQAAEADPDTQAALFRQGKLQV